MWAVEDCRHVTGRLEGDLLAAGERVVRVPPRLMAGARHAVRALGKSDPIDALAVARAALREPNLPTAGHDQASWEGKLLVNHREHLIAERTSAMNRLRWHLHRLDPRPRAHRPTPPWPIPGSHHRLVGRHPMVGSGRHLPGVDGRNRGADGAHRPTRSRPSHPGRGTGPNLLSLPGCGVLTAAKLLAETAGVARFRSEACFAMHAGVAPIPASSGRTDRHRLCRGGNRQLNAAIHRIAITQLCLAGLGQTYYRRRRTQGDSTGDAVRALKRRITRAVYQQLKQAEQRLRADSPAA